LVKFHRNVSIVVLDVRPPHDGLVLSIAAHLHPPAGRERRRGSTASRMRIRLFDCYGFAHASIPPFSTIKHLRNPASRDPVVAPPPEQFQA
jgi:hypothetical protein